MISCRETIWWKETIVAKNEIDLLIVKNDQKRGLNSTNISSAELRDDMIISVVVLSDVPVISGRNSPDVVTVLVVIDHTVANVPKRNLASECCVLFLLFILEA